MSTTEKISTVHETSARKVMPTPLLSRYIITLGLGVLSVSVMLGGWTLVTELGWVAPVFLPSPRAVLAEAAKLVATGELLSAVIASTNRVFIGFALAALVALRVV